MNRSINATTAKQAFVCRIYNGINVKRRNIRYRY